MNDNIDLIIKKIRNAMYLHRKDMYDYDMLVDFELDHNQWKELLTYLEQLQSNWNSLREWLEEQHQFIIEIPAYTKEISIEHKTMEICYENVLDKMNELEGVDNENN